MARSQRLKRRWSPRNLLLYEKKARSRGFALIAGVDEAGRGPIAGPVVASAVILKDTRFISVVKDSKLLSPKNRRIAYQEIIDKAKVGIGIVDEGIIDKINILQATFKAMAGAILDLGLEPDHLLIDGPFPIPDAYVQTCLINGESRSLSIACASIAAKVTRDAIMVRYDDLYPAYGFARHKGYCTREHRRALSKHGPSPIHRRSFSPLRKE